MPEYQSAYTNNPAAAYAGMPGDTQLSNIQSKQVTTGAVAFGLAVGRGATDNTVRLGGTGFEGIAIADKAQPGGNYAVGATAGIMTSGVVWVTASTAGVDPSAPVTFTAATGVIGAGLATTITGAKFLATAASGALVPVFLP